MAGNSGEPGPSDGRRRFRPRLAPGDWDGARVELNGRQPAWDCPDCGATVEQERHEFGSWAAAWAWPAEVDCAGDRMEHDCRPARERRGREAAAAAVEGIRLREEQERAFQAPSPERAAVVRAAVGLPRWICGGLEWLPAGRVAPAVVGRLMQDRAAWLAGGRPEKGVWLWGPTGGWKTTALGAFVFDLRNRLGIEARWWNLQRLRDELRLQAAGQPSDWDPTAARRAVVLGLDDLTRQRANDTGMEVLYSLVNAAYDGYGGDREGGQRLYVSSNEDPDRVLALLRRADPEGAAPVVRRLVRLCEVVEVRGR